MIEETMPAIEAEESEDTAEAAHYEYAFHILPMIADEEVPGVVDELKSLITHAGGTVTSEEISERYDLAYEITRQVDGTNRRFNAAHFGWIRFTLAPATLPAVIEEIAQRTDILRYIVIRLTREEVERPFSIFEARHAKDQSGGETLARVKGASGKIDEGVAGELSEDALDQSLEKLTAD